MQVLDEPEAAVGPEGRLKKAVLTVAVFGVLGVPAEPRFGRAGCLARPHDPRAQRHHGPLRRRRAGRRAERVALRADDDGQAKGFSFRKKRQAAPRRTSSAASWMAGSPSSTSRATASTSHRRRSPRRCATSSPGCSCTTATGCRRGWRVTSALVGEGVTYITRSLAAVHRLRHAGERSSSSTSTGAGRRRGGRGRAARTGRRDRERRARSTTSSSPTTNPRLSLVPAGAVPVARRPALASGHGARRRRSTSSRSGSTTCCSTCRRCWRPATR